MIVLVSGATKTFRRYLGHPNFGHLKTPRNGNRIGTIVASGHIWAADNDCGPRGDLPSAFDSARFRSMLRAIAEADRSRFLWVACPDVVGDAAATLRRFDAWQPEVATLGLPVALVGQDGAENLDLPWDRCAALFVGGSTGWKESAAAMGLADEARRRGKFVHVGRVNTLRRLRKVFDWGCVDTIDGTCFSRWPDKFFPWFLGHLTTLEAQPMLWERSP